MCGITGILGVREAAPRLLDGLRRLEYRGYDSAGIATLHEGRLDRRRAAGKLVNLSALLAQDPLRGTAGIGHTRWATHGAPTVQNAHPHRAGPVAVVHNGIIENYRTLRDRLRAGGAHFETGTDTETVAKLCESLLAGGLPPVEATRQTVAALEGAYALLFLFDGANDLLVAVCRGSPLVLGHGKGEMFVASDAQAMASMTGRVTCLEDGDLAIITRQGAEILDAAGNRANREMRTIPRGAEIMEKGPHKHFMAREIAEQPEVLAAVLRAYGVTGATAARPHDGLDFAGIERVTLVACGTAYLACQVAKYWFESMAGLPADVDIASEFRHRAPPLTENSYAIFVSQSGETADTLAALRYTAEKVRKTIAVVNVAESSISRACDVPLPTLAGPEIGVASTKAFTCQLAVLLALVLRAGQQRGHPAMAEARNLKTAMRALPGVVRRALGRQEAIRAACQELAEARNALFLGRGLMYPLALEGALKLKEISYIHAEGYAGGELKHGPLALVDEHMPVIVLAPAGPLFDKNVNTIQEVMARGGRIILVTDAAGAAAAGAGGRTILLPPVADVLAPIVYAIPVQLLAYHTAVIKGTDVDQPRNLAKSVTVE
ncbi:MAG: glutamine--fructose-6-phosphate transaminase (isomerizing) [Rhodobacteraceae bacterium]|nr:glutamine--fructose-6-phosphate transaminase (isomerizing) [Paracoccaceae bacterium]